MSKLFRNRITLIALPVSLVFILLLVFVTLVLNFDPRVALGVILVCLLLCSWAFIAWRFAAPLSFWNFLLFVEPYNALFYNNRGAAYWQLADYERALEDYETGIRLQPKAKVLAFLHNGRLALFTQMGRYEEAIQEAQHALQLQPSSSKLASAATYYNRGCAYQQLFVYDAALSDYEQALRNRRIAPLVYLSRGLIYAAQGHYQQAIEEEARMIKGRPRQPMGYVGRTIVHLKYQQYQKALADCNRALSLSGKHRLLTRRGGNYPYTATIYARRALAHLGLGNKQAAMSDARKSVELAPVYGPNFYALGQVHLALNDISQAQQTFEQGFKADARDVSNAALLAWTNMCTTVPDIEQASFLNEAAKNYPESDWGHLCRGIAAWLRGDYGNARAYLTHAQELDVTNPHYYFWLGMLHISQEEDELAQAAIQQAMQFRLAHSLLMPLRYFEQKRPDYYQHSLLPFLMP